MSDLIERWYPLSEGFAVLREAMGRGQNHEEWARISPAEAKEFRDDFAKGRDLIEAQQAEIARLRETIRHAHEIVSDGATFYGCDDLGNFAENILLPELEQKP